MKKLILIAGASCSGKTTLMEKIKNGKLPTLNNMLDFNLSDQWKFVEAFQLERFSFKNIDNLVLHYEIIRQYQNGNYGLISELFDHYEHINVITLQASPLLLFFRNSIRLLNHINNILMCDNFRTWTRKTKMFIQMEIFYFNFYYSTIRYKNWFEYLNKCLINKHIILDTSKISFNINKSLTDEIYHIDNTIGY